MIEVILLKDVKGKGKKEDVIKVPNGYANFLLKSNSAKLANENNMQKLHETQEKRAADEAKHVAEMEELKAKIEEQKINFILKSGKDGKLFGAINSKQISDQYKKEHGITIDKKKINLKDSIKSIGEFSVEVKLYKNIVAKLKVIVSSN